MVWDPFGTLAGALWIGGAQWAGKSTVARLLAHRHGITTYHYDYQDGRGRDDRRVARRVRRGEPPHGPTPDAMWVDTTPEEMAAHVLADFAAGFDWTLDDLRALVSGRPVLAEGWGLRPELVAPLLDSPRRMVVLVPTPRFQAAQAATLPRAAALSHPVRDPDLAQRNRLARDRLAAQDAVHHAREHGIRVIEVDGSIGADGMADLVADHFRPYLPAD